MDLPIVEDYARANVPGCITFFKVMPSLFSLCVLLLFIHFCESLPQCDGIFYNVINDPRRSTAFVTDPKQYICDRSIMQDNAWYRFSSEAGSEMATETPERGRCGTYIPIWMNGSHPNVIEGTVTRKACAAVPISSVDPNCSVSYSIKVRNCSGYYIYRLKKIRQCYMAYCAGRLVESTVCVTIGTILCSCRSIEIRFVVVHSF